MNYGEDHIGVAVVFACHDGEGNYLFAYRTKNCRDEKEIWDIGGGAVEFSDTLITSLKKEIKEEYCTDVLDHEFLGYRDVFREENGKRTHWLAMDFKVLVNRAQVKLGEPHKLSKMGWFAPKDFPCPNHSQLPTFFKKYWDKL